MTDSERVERVTNAHHRVTEGLHYLASQALDQESFAAFVDALLAWVDGTAEPAIPVTRRAQKMVALAHDVETLALLLPPAEYAALRAGLPERLARLWQPKAGQDPALLRVLDS